MTPRAKRVGRGGACRHWFKCTVPPLGDYISVKEVIKPVKIDGFPALMNRLFITIYRTRVLRNGEMQVKRERICWFICKNLLNPPQGKRVPVVLVFNRLKNKELISTYTTRNTVNRLPRKELYFNPVVRERSKEE